MASLNSGLRNNYDECTDDCTWIAYGDDAFTVPYAKRETGIMAQLLCVSPPWNLDLPRSFPSRLYLQPQEGHISEIPLITDGDRAAH